MTILFFHLNGIQPNNGGISRITYNLINEFSHIGIAAYALGLKTKDEIEYEKWQYFLPLRELESKENKDCLLSLINKLKVDVIVNQAALDHHAVCFIDEVHQINKKVKIISCIHNSVLTQIKNYPFQIESKLCESHKTFIFKALSLKITRYALELYGILSRHSQYLKMLESSDKVVMLSPGHRKELVKMLCGRYGKKIAYIPNCILNVSNEEVFEEKENLVLWVGTVDRSVKRIDFILDVWEQFWLVNKGWKLLVLGDGPALEWAKKQVKKRNLQTVDFLGRVNPEPYYRKAKISCVTSSHESFSMVILESFSAGVVPIVNNSFPSASYLIKNAYNGRLANEFDRKSFLKCLQETTSSKETLNAMAHNALLSAKKYTAGEISKMWIELFQKLINKE